VLVAGVDDSHDALIGRVKAIEPEELEELGVVVPYDDDDYCKVDYLR